MPAQCFEFLGSTNQHQTALGPGRNSFTTALIYALKELSSKAEGFSVSELLEEIERAPHFNVAGQKPSYDPCWGERRSGPKLRIRPLMSQTTPAPVASVSNSEDTIEKAQYFVRVDLTFSQCPEERDVIVLANDLAQLVKTSATQVSSVLWCMLSRQTKLTSLEKFQQVAWKVYRQRRLTAKSQDELPTLNRLSAVMPPRATGGFDEVSPTISPSGSLQEHETEANHASVEKTDSLDSASIVSKWYPTVMPALAIAFVMGTFMGRASYSSGAFGAI